MRSEKDKMLAGELYRAGDPELQALAWRAKEWMAAYNAMSVAPTADRHAKLSQIMAHVGEDAVIRPPFYCDYGMNIRLGRGVFLNFNCVLLDVVEISIGDLTQIGPGVQILTPDHPREAEARREGLEFGRPIRIGSNVWIGGGALLMPGVTVGDDAIIGAGAVVTRDVGAGVTVGGNPARVLGRAGGA
ncbi:sugar O-acetyltransferase [Limimaricola hongkongensis]|uniref:Nodulation protein L n=1 Tax=Limimaricola hongkongensis DSM 17492 TaxID=1122180 RepID=A0A017HHI4_9RHOB|nr:sugar O-acetyltransferase [Limimaricola hongkongensis]EYD73816.1 Maltose O-acetyltransferase [Limimaricola hongkongensis DSM 17492]